jgi:chromosome segregation ATPase
MIASRFKYASIKVGFGSTQNNAWTKLKSQRASIANNLASAQANLASITSALASAQQDKIAGLGTLAATAAIARVRAEAKAKSESLTAQLDSAQKALDSANAVKTTKPKFVSWALTQTVDTTA